MVYITEHAKAALLAAKRAARADHAEDGLRLTFGRDGTLGLVLDREKAGDAVVKHEDAVVLLIDPEMSALIVAGRVMDCRQTGSGRVEFFLRRRRAGEQPSSAVA